LHLVCDLSPSLFVDNNPLTAPRLKLLLLTHRVPYPPNRGDRIRAYHLLKFLASRHDVSLACLADEPTDAATEDKLRSMTERLAIISLTGTSRWICAALKFASGKTATSGLFASTKLKETIRNWTKTTRFDGVIAYCSSMAPYAFMPELKESQVFVDLVDVDSQKWLDYSESSRGLKSYLYELEGCRLRREEERLAKTAAAITLVSEAEAELFRSACPNSRTHAILNGVDLDYFQPHPRESSTRPFSCVFVGALDYGANIDGLNWFCNQVWPEVRSQEPRATLELVGRCPTKSIQQLAELPGITIAPNVPDVRPYLQDAAVVIAPLRIARGIQNKVLEAMAMGKAVLASPGALTGLETQPGVDVLQAESPSEWVSGLRELWQNETLTSNLGLRARQYVETHHAWERTLEPWSELLAGTATQSSAAAVPLV